MLTEIKYLIERFNVSEIQFLDSNFITRKEYIKELCHSILENNLSLALCAPNGSRLEYVDEEVCALLSRAGFYRMNVGIESGSQEILQMVRKTSNLANVSKKVALLQKHGIQVVGNFMIGFPGETKEQVERTLRFALSLDLTAANFSIYVPMPGTTLSEELVRSGKLPSVRDFKNYNYVSYKNCLSKLSPEELKHFRNKCVLRFLLRRKNFKTLYTTLRSGMSYKDLIQRFYGMYISRFIKDLAKASS